MIEAPDERTDCKVKWKIWRKFLGVNVTCNDGDTK